MQKKKKVFSKKQIILYLAAICFFVGFILGGISVKTENENAYINVSSEMEDYIKNYETEKEHKLKIFWTSLVKHSKPILIIWFLGFVPIGGFFIFFLVMLRGLNYGYTTVIFISMFGSSGFVTALIMYLLQGLVMILAYFFMTYCSINYILYNSSKENKFSKKTDALKGYAFTLLIGISFAIGAASIDAFITPRIVEKMLL